MQYWRSWWLNDDVDDNGDGGDAVSDVDYDHDIDDVVYGDIKGLLNLEVNERSLPWQNWKAQFN